MYVLALLGPTAVPEFKAFKKFVGEKFLLHMTRKEFGLFMQHFPV